MFAFGALKIIVFPLSEYHHQFSLSLCLPACFQVCLSVRLCVCVCSRPLFLSGSPSSFSPYIFAFTFPFPPKYDNFLCASNHSRKRGYTTILIIRRVPDDSNDILFRYFQHDAGFLGGRNKASLPLPCLGMELLKSRHLVASCS